MDLTQRFFAAQDLFGNYVKQIHDDQWDNLTPCTDWNVRELVNHMTYEDLWLPDLFAGKTIEEVGDRYEGDMLGENPKQSWRSAVDKTRPALAPADVLARTLHLSYGDSTGESYLTMLFSDHMIHSWDLAKGIGAEYNPPEKLLQAVWDWMAPREKMLSASDLFGHRVEVPDSAGVGEKLMGLAGRRWDWQPPLI